MYSRRALVPLLVSLSLGCTAHLSANGSSGGARVSAQVDANHPAGAAAGLLATGLALAAGAAASDSQSAPGADVHTPTVVARGGGAGSAESAGAGVAVEVQRIGVRARGDVIVGGTIRVVGVAPVRGLFVVDGDVELARGSAASGASGAWTVAGGAVLLAAPDGRRWRCRVGAGTVRVRRDPGTSGGERDGTTVWAPEGGELYVTVTAEGDDALALVDRSPSATTQAGSAATTALNRRELDALDLLLHAAPDGSAEALRLAAAVETVIHNAESASPYFYTTPIVGRQVVLVVDVSYSMRDPDPTAVSASIGADVRPTKLDVARAELVKVLASLPPDVRVNVVAFSSAHRALWAAPRAVDDAGLSAAVRWIAALRCEDETHPLQALEAAAAMRPDQVVLLTDGRPSVRAPGADPMLAFATRLHADGARLDVVGIGPDQDRAWLATLAEHGHGSIRLR